MTEETNIPENESEEQSAAKSDAGNEQQSTRNLHLSGLYRNWFLDYASYVILERAVPDIRDGLKPVQRRILHAMKELDDGRFNKVANVIGHTMKYHPHGDASIGDALVQIGQKDLLVETQGNWGNIHTGDSAAAPRYIEARLSKFALEVLFNPKTTEWTPSYDGRNKEPVWLPAKFPLLLAQGGEGIAVGLTSKILPHNFVELIEASIDFLNGVETDLFPDFPTGGLADFSRYNDGARGSRVRIRARILQQDKKTLKITEIPFGTTTGTLIESIINANDKGKIKIRKIEDNTAEKVEILIHLVPGVSPDTTIDALYAFTNCEVTVSPSICVIDGNRPRFITVRDLLQTSTLNTVELLRKELEIQKAETLAQWFFSSLEKIFIEKEVYLRMKKARTDEEIDNSIMSGLKPWVKELIRPVTVDDVHRLRKIPIDRISKYNTEKADMIIRSLEDDVKQIDHDLAHIVDYAIAYFERIRKKYSAGRGRKTEIRNFDTIEAALVAAANQKLYVNREEGFAGTSLKKDEFVCDCSDIDDIIVFRADGSFLVTRVTEKVFVGKDIIHINVFKKNDERTIYNMIYQDGKRGPVMVKRFAVLGITRDKEYSLTKGTPDSRVLYFTANPNGEAEIITVSLRPKPRLKILSFEYDFSTLAIKGRNSIGNILSKNPVRKITLRDEGVSTLGARDIWYDETVNRLNAEQRGKLLGAFQGEDRIITLNRGGFFKIYSFDLATHFEEDILRIEKFDPKRIYTAVYMDGESGAFFVKRFHAEITDKKCSFISEAQGSELVLITADTYPVLKINYQKNHPLAKAEDTLLIGDFIGIKSFKAKGKRLPGQAVASLKLLEPLPEPEKPEEADDSENSITNEVMPETEETAETLFEEEDIAPEIHAEVSNAPKIKKEKAIKEPKTETKEVKKEKESEKKNAPATAGDKKGKSKSGKTEDKGGIQITLDF